MKWNKLLIKTLALHLGLMVVVVTISIFLFFQCFLPMITRHNQLITVPNLQGRSLTEASAYLSERNLRFEITNEMTYAPEYPPEAILQQYPLPGTGVKAGRSIFLTLNTNTPPQVAMPNLVDSSVRNARILLQSQGLLLGKLYYKADMAKNAVLEQHYQGQAIVPGTTIGKGAKIDLVVGTGLAQNTVVVPNVVAMQLVEAELTLLDHGVRAGIVTYLESKTQPAGMVLRQQPEADQTTSPGTTIDLWLAALPEEATTQTSNAPILPTLPEEVD